MIYDIAIIGAGCAGLSLAYQISKNRNIKKKIIILDNKTEFKKIEFIIPPLPEQKAIAKVLTAFDDKIELLQAQNKTLETIAQTIFKEWFGKYQVGDELPEGWRVGKFGEVIEFINGYAFKSKDLSKEPIEDSFKAFKMI